jgi:hypothetical protein
MHRRENRVVVSLIQTPGLRYSEDPDFASGVRN